MLTHFVSMFQVTLGIMSMGRLTALCTKELGIMSDQDMYTNVLTLLTAKGPCRIQNMKGYK